MKKITLLIALFVSTLTIAQEKITEGVINQKVTFSSPNEQVNEQMSTMFKEMNSVTYIKGNKSATEANNQLTGNTRSVIDMDAKKMIMLIDSPMAGKMAMETSLDLSKEDLSKIKITPVDETKKVLGYTCKRFDVEMEGQGQVTKMTLFVTDKIQVKGQATATFGDKIKGFPMITIAYMNQMGMDITSTTEVTEIKKEKVSDDKFDMTIPEGYQKM